MSSKPFNRLKALRAEKGWTQEEMAKELEMNVDTYRKKKMVRENLLCQKFLRLRTS